MHFPFSKSTKHFFLFALFLLSHTNLIRTLDTVEGGNRPTQTFSTLNTESLSKKLDFVNPIEVSIKSFDGQEDDQGFCTTSIVPFTTENKPYTGPEIASSYLYNGQFVGVSKSVVNYKGYYLVLAFASNNLNVNIMNITQNGWQNVLTLHPETPEALLESDISLRRAFLSVDYDNNILYVVTKVNIYSYNLAKFIQAKASGSAPSTVMTKSRNYIGSDYISTVAYHQNRLYIAADDIVEVYKTDSQGEIALQAEFNADFFGVSKLSVVDIAIRDTHIFILDNHHGVFVVDISSARAGETDDVSHLFQYLPSLDLPVLGGKFIEVNSQTLQIIPGTIDDDSYVSEYLIKGYRHILGFELNRKSFFAESYYNLPVKGTFSDNTYLYVLVNNDWLPIKHSIPSRFDIGNLGANNNVINDGSNSMIATTVKKNKQGTELLFINSETPSFVHINSGAAYFECNALAKTPADSYTYEIQAVEKDCTAKTGNPFADFSTVCVTSSTIELIVKSALGDGVELKQENRVSTVSRATTTESPSEPSDKTPYIIFLIIGIIALILAAVVVYWLLTKHYYRNRRRVAPTNGRIEVPNNSPAVNAGEDDDWEDIGKIKRPESSKEKTRPMTGIKVPVRPSTVKPEGRKKRNNFKVSINELDSNDTETTSNNNTTQGRRNHRHHHHDHSHNLHSHVGCRRCRQSETYNRSRDTRQTNWQEFLGRQDFAPKPQTKEEPFKIKVPWRW